MISGRGRIYTLLDMLEAKVERYTKLEVPLPDYDRYPLPLWPPRRLVQKFSPKSSGTCDKYQKTASTIHDMQWVPGCEAASYHSRVAIIKILCQGKKTAGEMAWGFFFFFKSASSFYSCWLYFFLRSLELRFNINIPNGRSTWTTLYLDGGPCLHI